jgi:hypothetical protein
MPLNREHVECGFGDLVRRGGSELVGRSLRNGAHGRADVDYLLELALLEERDECGSDGVNRKNVNLEDVLKIGPIASRINVSVEHRRHGAGRIRKLTC